MSTAEDIANKFGGQASRNGYLISCPVVSHGKGQGDRKPSLWICDGADGGLIVHCFAGCARVDILAALGAEAGDRPQRDNAKTRDAKRRAYATRLYCESQPIEGTVVERYLRGRGLDPTIQEVRLVTRFHPGIWLEADQYHPGMLTLYYDIYTDAGCGLDQTFLTQDGSKITRLSVARTRFQAAAKLGKPTDKLVVGEGFETCIAAHMLGLRPVWALGSATGVRFFPVLRGIKQLTILREHDPTGREAAEACALRWLSSGREVLFNQSPIGKDHADFFKERER
jgi:hypothetical protein